MGRCLQGDAGARRITVVVVCCLLFGVCCLLFVVCCLLFVVCCLLFVVCCGRPGGSFWTNRAEAHGQLVSSPFLSTISLRSFRLVKSKCMPVSIDPLVPRPGSLNLCVHFAETFLLRFQQFDMFAKNTQSGFCFCWIPLRPHSYPHRGVYGIWWEPPALSATTASPTSVPAFLRK